MHLFLVNEKFALTIQNEVATEISFTNVRCLFLDFQ